MMMKQSYQDPNALDNTKSSRMRCGEEIDGILRIKLWEARTNGEIFTYFITKLARKERVLSDKVLRSLSALIYCRDLDTTTMRELIDSEGRLILEDPQSIDVGFVREDG
nr:hypothetical protein [Tanacetum cinerariifolium]